MHGSPSTSYHHDRLQEIFARSNMTDLPAMSGNVRELLALTYSSRSAAPDLAEVILRDYSLTNKVLRVVNSAYYSLPQRVNSVSRAVTIIGFEAIRELATTIAIFEDFIKAGVERDEISRLLTRSLLSAVQARLLVDAKEMRVAPEEAFLCSLLHTLGQIVVLVYLPDVYRRIALDRPPGTSMESAAREQLNDLSFQEIGEELAKHWNLSESIVASMTAYPPLPRGAYDREALLQNLAAFTNGYTAAVCEGPKKRIAKVVQEFGAVLDIDPAEAAAIIRRAVEIVEDFSGTIRYGLTKLKIRSRLEKL